MIIFPAIDLKDGKPVRLTKGDFATTEQVAEDALKTAREFEREGASHLHMVDLDGALKQEPVNDAIVREVVKNTNLFVEIGGGIRTAGTVEYYLREIGVSRVILGSVAIKNPGFAKEMIIEYGEKIAIGIDAKDGKVSGSGWLEDSDIYHIDLARLMSDAGAKTIIYTDIGRDGMLSGPDLDGLKALKKAVAADIIASGGVTDINDIKALAALGMAGVICGKSIYRGTLSLKDALAAVSLF
jgi:phosphoribosylformimino-5-aminoimidazole carboxamide ribotide isomerase